ncbi:MAG: PspC domain-containing protein [Oscillochloridaceae bacterium umkhey_bin13]
MMMNTSVRLLRSRSDRMLAGVAGGIAHYLGVDPVIVRLILVLLAFSGPALFFYPILWLVMPEEPAHPADNQVFVATGATQRLRIEALSGGPGETEHEVPINDLGATSQNQSPQTNAGQSKLIGYVLLGLGGFLVLQAIWPGAASLVFPVALIAAGFWLLRRG